jgi:hypothetical protein
MKTVLPFDLTEEQQRRFADFCKRYYTSDAYKSSQKYLRDLVRKNTERLYNIKVPTPPEK